MPAKRSKTIKKVKKVIAKKVIAKKAVKVKVAVKTPSPTSPRLRGASKIAVSKPTKTGSFLSASVFDIKGKVAGHIELPSEIFNAKINDSLMSQAVRVYLANQRQGTVKTKDRGEVNATTKKIWQQKG